MMTASTVSQKSTSRPQRPDVVLHQLQAPFFSKSSAIIESAISSRFAKAWPKRPETRGPRVSARPLFSSAASHRPSAAVENASAASLGRKIPRRRHRCCWRLPSWALACVKSTRELGYNVAPTAGLHAIDGDDVHTGPNKAQYAPRKRPRFWREESFRPAVGV